MKSPFVFGLISGGVAFVAFVAWRYEATRPVEQKAAVVQVQQKAAVVQNVKQAAPVQEPEKQTTASKKLDKQLLAAARKIRSAIQAMRVRIDHGVAPFVFDSQTAESVREIIVSYENIGVTYNTVLQHARGEHVSPAAICSGSVGIESVYTAVYERVLTMANRSGYDLTALKIRYEDAHKQSQQECAVAEGGSQ